MPPDQLSDCTARNKGWLHFFTYLPDRETDLECWVFLSLGSVFRKQVHKYGNREVDEDKMASPTDEQNEVIVQLVVWARVLPVPSPTMTTVPSLHFNCC